MKSKSCESCFMPLDQDPGVSESDRYCSLCFRDGKLCYEGDWKGFRDAAYAGMIARGMHPFKARFFAWMTRFAPRWRGTRAGAK